MPSRSHAALNQSSPLTFRCDNSAGAQAMTHYVYEIPAGTAPNRQIGAYGRYEDASAFARAERQKLKLGDDMLILVVHADGSESADASAARLREQFDEARKARQAPRGRVAQFVLNFPPEPEEPEPNPIGPALLEHQG